MNNWLWRILLGVSLAILPLVSIINNLAFAQEGAPPPEVYEQLNQQHLMILFLAIGLPVSIGIGIGLSVLLRKRKKQTAVK